MTIRVGAVFVQLIRNASTKPTTNSVIKPFIYNRNPRNLQRLRLERKPVGYFVDNKDVEYWNKLNIIEYNKFIVAQVVHHTNTVVVEATTREWAIRKFLYSATDKQAFIILGRVFAERCMESGVDSMKCEMYKKDEVSPNLSAFLQTLEEEGIILEEAMYFNIYDIWRRKREQKPWTVLEQS